MALYYSLVFGLLVIEMALFTLLSLPLPSKIRRPLLTGISSPFQKPQVSVAIKCILVFILILFVDAVNKLSSINEELHGFNAKNTGASFVADRSEIQARRFYAQRNLYLTGFTLFLTLIVTRTYGLVAELLVLKDQYRSNPDGIKSNEEIESLNSQIKQKDEDLEILKSQSAAISKEYDEVSNQLNKPAASTSSKVPSTTASRKLATK